MSSGARALTQCGKKRMQIHREPTPIWMSMMPVCFWNLWLVDIFEKNCTVSVITMVLATVTVVTWQACALYLSSIVALTTSYIRVLHFCGQVPFLYVIIVGFVAVGQARLSHRTSRCTRWSTEDHGTPHSAHSRSAVMPHAEQMTLQRWQKKCLHCRALTPLSHTPSFTRNFVTHIHIHTYVRTYIHACMHAYIRARRLSFHIPSCFVTHRLSHSTLSHTQLF